MDSGRLRSDFSTPTFGLNFLRRHAYGSFQHLKSVGVASITLQVSQTQAHYDPELGQ